MLIRSPWVCPRMGTQCVVQVVVQIRDPVRPADALRFRCFGLHFSGVGKNALADFLGQVQPCSPVFKHFHHPQALLIVPEAFRQKFIQCSLPDMAVGSMPQVVPQGDGFGQVFIQAEGTGQRPCNLGHLKRVGQAGPVMIPFRRKKNLGLEFQPAEGFAVDDPVPVPLELRPQVVRGNRRVASGGFCSVSRPGCEDLV